MPAVLLGGCCHAGQANSYNFHSSMCMQKRFARYARTALESPITLVFLLGSLAVLLTRAATAGASDMLNCDAILVA